jgi:hypothetical protein
MVLAYHRRCRHGNLFNRQCGARIGQQRCADRPSRGAISRNALHLMRPGQNGPPALGVQALKPGNPCCP